MAIPVVRSSSKPAQGAILTLVRITLTSVSLVFFASYLLLYFLDVWQLGRQQIILLSVISAAIITPLVNWQHAKRAQVIEAMQRSLSTAKQQDDITGLLSRRFFYELAEREVQLAERHSHSVSVVLFEVTNLVHLSKQFGDLLTDQSLHACANLLKSSLRETDILARFSEHQFVLLMPHTEFIKAQEVALRLAENASKSKLSVGEQSLQIQLKIGLASSQGNLSLQGLLQKAEASLFD